MKPATYSRKAEIAHLRRLCFTILTLWIYLPISECTHFRGGHIWFTPTGQFNDREVSLLLQQYLFVHQYLLFGSVQLLTATKECQEQKSFITKSVDIGKSQFVPDHCQ